MFVDAAEYSDSDLAWCIQLYRSHPERCLGFLRQHYPDSRIVLLVDGDNDNLPRYHDVGRRFDAEVVVGEHLMRFETCHSYVDRLLKIALNGDERFFFRIDPDTRVWRRFRRLPAIDCIFGTLETTTVAFGDRVRHPPNVQGGCVGLTRNVIQTIQARSLLTYESCVSNARVGWIRCQDCEHIASSGKMSDDFILSWAADMAGFPVSSHPEIASYWRHAIDNQGFSYAITHPHKEMDQPIATFDASREMTK